jgi:hypothetical protein
MSPMSRRRSVDSLVALLARLVLLMGDRLWPGVLAWLRAIGRAGPLPRLRAAVARMPPWLALPLFLIPEVASRTGWVASVWLLLEGQVWAALITYVATKLLAGAAAFWIYHACAPALLRVHWFAQGHGAMLGLRHTASAWLASAVPRRFRARLQRLRAENAGADPAPASPSPPDAPPPTG